MPDRYRDLGVGCVGIREHQSCGKQIPRKLGEVEGMEAGESDELRGIAEIAGRHDLLVLSDEIYNVFCYDRPYLSIANFYAGKFTRLFNDLRLIASPLRNTAYIASAFNTCSLLYVLESVYSSIIVGFGLAIIFMPQLFNYITRYRVWLLHLFIN